MELCRHADEHNGTDLPPVFNSLVPFMYSGRGIMQILRAGDDAVIKSLRVFETGSVFRDILMENTPQNIIYSGDCADLGVIMPGYSGNIDGSFKILLLPGKITDCKAETVSAVTYGMSPQDTVTLSSVGVEKCVLAIQREITDIFGKTIEPQELVIPRMQLAPDFAMAASTALLLAGVNISDI